MQELRHRMQDLERRLAERERDQRSLERSPTRSRSRSRSRCTPSPQCESVSTEERIRPRRRSRDPIIYARHERRRASNRGNEEPYRENNELRRTARGPVIIGATPFHRSPAYNQSRHFEARERPKEHAKDGGPSKPSKPFPRIGRFTNYTPLTASITEVYQQIAEKGILSKPRPLKDRTGGNKNLYCEYHKGYGHKTQDCFDLKDALEQAIRDGKLADFSHLIREPRRRNRDNDNEDRSRPTRRRQEPEGDDHGLTVVNVVTARNTAPRSKSAQKKDAKVLAISALPGRVEVYVDDILAKTARPDDLLSDLNDVFSSLRQHGMRLNPLKCAFAMEAGKFLGFMITQRGVEANPEKCQAVLQMKSPGCIKDVQRLAGRLTALSRFLGASAAKAIPFFNLIRKGMTFEWTPACEEAFNHFKQILAAPPVLGKPRAGEPLYLYLSVTEEALAAVLVTEEARTQQPVYFVSRALQGPELRYSKLERLALALLVSSRRLRQYFQSHRIVVRTDQAIRQILQKPDLAGRMMTWAIELSQYELQYEPRHAIKAQAMADFLVEVTGDPPEKTGYGEGANGRPPPDGGEPLMAGSHHHLPRTRQVTRR
ncbi:uncharacterized protein LOC107632564 [Arachis ipaensis]|uniref:uncharacterized protein LOC107632564 n=1 Tax=Arachis ipaensis TaxID=130454 RepID=UPI0007AF563E|nr:uncharacterized protein LOC107632564 [Arachis ipaensis]